MKKGLIKMIEMLVVVAVSFTAFNLTTFAAETLKTPEVSISVTSTFDPTIRLSWKKIDGANSYYIYRRDTKKGSRILRAINMSHGISAM